MVVVAQGKYQVKHPGKGGFTLQVDAELVQVVVILVPAHDCTFGIRPRHQRVQAVRESLAGAQIRRMLRLENREGGSVDHGSAGTQQKGAARIGPVAEGLDKPVAVQHPQLGVVVLPVYRLRGAHGSQPDQVRLVVSRRQDGGEVVGGAPIQTRFQAEILGIGIAGLEAADKFKSAAISFISCAAWLLPLPGRYTPTPSPCSTGPKPCSPPGPRPRLRAESRPGAGCALHIRNGRSCPAR